MAYLDHAFLIKWGCIPHIGSFCFVDFFCDETYNHLDMVRKHLIYPIIPITLITQRLKRLNYLLLITTQPTVVTPRWQGEPYRYGHDVSLTLSVGRQTNAPWTPFHSSFERLQVLSQDLSRRSLTRWTGSEIWRLFSMSWFIICPIVFPVFSATFLIFS